MAVHNQTSLLEMTSENISPFSFLCTHLITNLNSITYKLLLFLGIWVYISKQAYRQINKQTHKQTCKCGHDASNVGSSSSGSKSGFSLGGNVRNRFAEICHTNIWWAKLIHYHAKVDATEL